jgi:parallel beta-helix repeat protein
MRTGHKLAFWTGILAVAGGATVAGAVDGVIEINQAKALAGGVTAGDSPGFPVTITGPGSYRLTSNLDTGGGSPGAIATGIAVAGDITIDLNGFTIDGGSSASNGIQLSDGDNWEIRNGTVRGFVNGIQQSSVSDGHRVVGIRAIGNTSSGIALANGSGHLVKDCLALDNGGDGIRVGMDSTVTGSTAFNNSGDGIDVSSGSRVTGNVANGNGVDGIEASGDSVLIGNTADDNTGGTVDGGSQMGTNVCNGNSICP